MNAAIPPPKPKRLVKFQNPVTGEVETAEIEGEPTPERMALFMQAAGERSKQLAAGKGVVAEATAGARSEVGVGVGGTVKGQRDLNIAEKAVIGANTATERIIEAITPFLSTSEPIIRSHKGGGIRLESEPAMAQVPDRMLPGLIGGIATLPAHIGADALTLTHPQSTLEQRARAGANLLLNFVGPGEVLAGGRLLSKPLQQAYKTAVNGKNAVQLEKVLIQAQKEGVDISRIVKPQAGISRLRGAPIEGLVPRTGAEAGLVGSGRRPPKPPMKALPASTAEVKPGSNPPAIPMGGARPLTASEVAAKERGAYKTPVTAKPSAKAEVRLDHPGMTPEEIAASQKKLGVTPPKPETPTIPSKLAGLKGEIPKPIESAPVTTKPAPKRVLIEPPPAPKEVKGKVDGNLADRYTFTRHLSEEGKNTADSAFAQIPATKLTIPQMRAAAEDYASSLKPQDLQKLQKSGRSYEEVGGLITIGDNAANQAADLRLKATDPTLDSAERLTLESQADKLESLAFEAYEKSAPGITGAGRVLRFLQERPNADALNGDYLMRLADKAARKGGKEAAPDPVKKKIVALSTRAKAKQAQLDKLEAESNLMSVPKVPRVQNIGLYGSGNKIVTKEVYDADVDLIRKKLGQASLNPFADFELISALTRAVGFHVEAGVRATPELFRQVKALVGDKVSDADIWKIVKQGTGKYAARVNQGRSFGEDVMVAGKQGQIDPQFKALRKEIDELRYEIAHEIAMLDKPGFWERTRIRHRAFRLSNPVARVHDLIGNSMVAVQRIPETAIKSTLDRALFPRLAKSQGAANTGYSWTKTWLTMDQAHKRWWNEAKKQMMIGDPRVLHKFEIYRELPEAEAKTLGAKVAQFNPFGNKALNRINRLAGTTDIPFKDAAYRGTLAELAISEARKGGKVGLNDRAVQIFDEMIAGEEKWLDHLTIADEEALKTVFMGDNAFTDILRAEQGALTRRFGDKGHAILLAQDIIATFPRIFSNIAGYSTDSIYGAAKAAGKVGIMKRQGIPIDIKERRVINHLIARNMTGQALFWTGVAAYNWAKESGIIREINKKHGYVDFGDYGRAGGPLSLVLLGITSAIAKNEEMTDTQRGKLVWNTAVGLMADQPAVEGPKELLQALNTPKGTMEYLKKKGAQATLPALIREWARRQDAIIKTGTFGGKTNPNTSEPLGQFKANLPFLREKLPAK